MLVLSRKKKECIVIGGSSAFGRVVKLTILDIGGGQVRLGFEANEDVPINRMEVLARVSPGILNEVHSPVNGRAGLQGLDQPGR